MLSIFSDLPLTRKTEKNVYFSILQIKLSKTSILPNGVLASGWYKALLSYVIYSAYYCPPFVKVGPYWRQPLFFVYKIFLTGVISNLQSYAVLVLWRVIDFPMDYLCLLYFWPCPFHVVVWREDPKRSILKCYFKKHFNPFCKRTNNCNMYLLLQ